MPRVCVVGERVGRRDSGSPDWFSSLAECGALALTSNLPPCSTVHVENRGGVPIQPCQEGSTMRGDRRVKTTATPTQLAGDQEAHPLLSVFGAPSVSTPVRCIERKLMRLSRIPLPPHSPAHGPRVRVGVGVVGLASNLFVVVLIDPPPPPSCARPLQFGQCPPLI